MSFDLRLGAPPVGGFLFFCLQSKESRLTAPTATMSVFSAPKVGSSAAIGSRYGDISGTSTDILYPVSKLVNDQFQEGRTIEFNWKSDKHRHWHPRSTRLVHEFEFKFGEEWPCVAQTNPFIYNGLCAICSDAKPCLFDILADPGERVNLATKQPQIVAQLAKQMATYVPYVNPSLTAEELSKYDCVSTNVSGGVFPSPWWGEFNGPVCDSVACLH